MKRLLVFGLAILLSVGLAGCDLIPSEVIDVVSEELCREDPTNELCQLDSLNDLENEIILDLFNDILSNYTEDDLETYCEEYFSVSSTDLLDSCRLDKDTLFPMGIENFEAVSIDLVGDNYEILMMDITTNQTYQFKIGIHGGAIEGIAIGAWSYLEVITEHNGVNEMLLVEEIFSFIKDLEDTTKSNDDICAMWFDGEDNDCDSIANAVRKFKAGASLSKKVNILDPDDDGDGLLVGEVSYEIDGHVTVLKIKFDLDNTGDELKLLIRDISIDEDMINEIDTEEIKHVIELFIEDLEDPSITTDEICAMWYDGKDNDCDGIADAVRKFKAGADLSKKVNIMEPEDGFGHDLDASVSFDFNGHVTVLKIKIDIDNNGDELRLIVKGSEVEFSPNPMIKTELERLISDLSNPDLTHVEVCSIWGDGVDEDCDGVVAIDPVIKHVFVFKTIIPVGDVSDNPMYEATLESDFNGHVTVLKISFTEDENEGMRKIHISNLQSDIQMEFYPNPVIEAELEKLIFDLSNPDLTETEVCTIWGDGVDNDCDGLVAIDPVIKYIFVFKTIIPVDDDLDNPMYEATFESEFNGHVTVLKISFTEEDTPEGKALSNIYVSLFARGVDEDCDGADDDCDGQIEPPLKDYLNGMETVAALRIFLVDYLDPNISFDQFNENYFNGILNQEARIGRDARINDGATVRLLTEGDPLPGMDLFYKFDIEITRGLETEIVSLNIKFIRKEVQDVKNKAVVLNEPGDLFGDGIDNDCDGVDDDCDGIIDVDDIDEAIILYQMYLDVYNDPLVSRDILKTYFETVPSEEYFDLRDSLISSGAQIELVAIIGPDVCIGTYSVTKTDECTETFTFLYNIINGDEVKSHIEPVNIKKRIDKSTPLLSIVDDDDDGDGVPTEEKLVVLGILSNGLNVNSVTMEDYFANLINKGTDESTCPLSSPTHCSKAEGYEVDSIDFIEEDGFSYIRISQSPEDETSDLEDINVTFIIFFYYNEEGMIMFELVPSERIFEIDEPEVMLPVFTLDELAMYTGSNGSTAYIAVDGIVYDVTEEFDNGEHKDIQLGGTDATSVFASSPHGAALLATLTVVGVLEAQN